ncbi:MAG: hypothetical protein ACI81P_002116 [Neolewinella sp.]|jgi:hypothetical protein
MLRETHNLCIFNMVRLAVGGRSVRPAQGDVLSALLDLRGKTPMVTTHKSLYLLGANGGEARFTPKKMQT